MENKGIAQVKLVIGIMVLLISGGILAWTYVQNQQGATTSTPSSTTPSTTPNSTPTSTETTESFTPKGLAASISVRHDSSWKEFDDYSLTKRVNSRQYRMLFQENDEEFLVKGGAYARDLKLYKEITVNGKTHYVITSSPAPNADFAFLSSCPVKPDEACSPRLRDGYLFIMLHQVIPDGDASGGPDELDFDREDDKQILAEFATILTTLEY